MMATVRRSKAKAGKKKRDKEFDDSEDSGISLPTEYEEPSADINDYSFLLHGEKKIGKTTTALEGGRVLVLQFDPKQKAYKRLEIKIKSWKDWQKTIKLLEQAFRKGNKPYDRVVIDGADAWYKMCQEYVCEKLVINHPSEEAWGKGWDALRQAFTKAVDRLLDLPCGRWFLCHSAWKEIETHDGDEVIKLVPVLTKGAEEILNGKVDAWCAYDYVEGKRVLFVEGSERIGAGHRMDSEGYAHFRTPGGRRVAHIDMGDSPKQGYINLLAAFNNKQTYTVIKTEKGTGKRKKKRKSDDVKR